MKIHFIAFCLLIISGLLIFSSFKNSEKTDKKEKFMDGMNENVRTVLKNYKVTGFSFIDFTIDPNLAFFKETQNKIFLLQIKRLLVWSRKFLMKIQKTLNL